MSKSNALSTLDSIPTDALIKANEANGWPDVKSVEKAFASEYVLSRDHREAAEIVGKTRSAGIKLLKNPLVNAYIAFLDSKVATRRLIDRAYVESEMLNLYYMAKGEDEVNLVDKDGTQFTAKEANLPVASKLLVEMAKSTKFYEDGSSQGGMVNIGINLGAMGVQEAVEVRGIEIEGETRE